MKKVAVVTVVGMLALSGCSQYGHPLANVDPAVKGAVIGSVAGGVIGGALTGSWGGAVIGSGIGAAAGAAIGAHHKYPQSKVYY
jgi:Glycine zipper